MVVNVPELTSPSRDSTAIVNEQPRSAYWRFWGTLIWGIVIVAIFLGSQLTGVILAITLHHGSGLGSLQESLRNGSVLAPEALGGAVGSIGAVFSAISFKKGATIGEYLRLKRIPLRTLAKWIGIFVIFLFASGLLGSFIPRPKTAAFMANAYETAGPLWFFWLAVVVTGPLSEEIFFRGFLFRGFETSFLGPAGTIGVTAGVWALLHIQYDAFDVASIFVGGLLLGWARRDTDSLLMPIALHMLQNLLATTAVAVLR
jgi:membrane protease YdiL (CAAX protease family)